MCNGGEFEKGGGGGGGGGPDSPWNLQSLT